MEKRNKFLWYWGPITPTPFSSSASSLFILPKYLKFWKKSLEFSFYLILFGKHTVNLSTINQWNLIRFSFKKSNKKEQDQANWIDKWAHQREKWEEYPNILNAILYAPFVNQRLESLLCNKKKWILRLNLIKPQVLFVLLSFTWF